MEASLPTLAPRFAFPSARWTAFLAVIILFGFLTHLGFRSPYLYYTEGNYELVNKSYGLYLGPHHEIIHADALNYWSVEGLFSGKYGSGLGTPARPFYSFITSLFDNYYDRVYAGWTLNLLVWFLAALCGYAFILNLSGSPLSARVFSFLIVFSPAFINTCGQPMGYVLGYSLFIIFLCASTHPTLYADAPWDYAFLLTALGTMATLTYEILGPICLLFLVLFGFKRIRWKHLVFIIASVLLFRSLSTFLFNWIQGPRPPSIYTSQILALEQGLRAGIGKGGLTILSNFGYGILTTSFFVLPILALAVIPYLQGNVRRITAALLTATALPILYMGVLADMLGHSGYGFYKHGRIMTYFSPALYLAIAFGLVRLLDIKVQNTHVRRTIMVGLAVFYFIWVNLDIVDMKVFYYFFNNRGG